MSRLLIKKLTAIQLITSLKWSLCALTLSVYRAYTSSYRHSKCVLCLIVRVGREEAVTSACTQDE